MELEAEDKTGKISLEVIFLTYISGKHPAECLNIPTFSSN
jgi:hypothetical protein